MGEHRSAHSHPQISGEERAVDEEEEQQVMEEAKKTVNEQIKKAEQTRKMTIEGLIDSMFEETPQDLGGTESIYAAKEG